MPFADGAAAARARLHDRLGVPAVNRLPAALPPKLLRVVRVGGGDNRVTDTARVAVDAFAPTYDEAVALADDARAELAAPFLVDGVLIDRVTTDSGPTPVPYPDQDVVQVTATYSISTRSRRQ